MRIIDIHVHVFPDKIAKRATQAVGKFYNIPMSFDGTLSSALRQADKAGIEKFVIHSVATTPQQVNHINDFIYECRAKYPDRVIPFAAIHPGLTDVNRKMDEIVRAGFMGVKIHPDIQNFRLDDEGVLKMIDAIAGRLPLLIHTGDYRYDNSGPVRMERVLDMYPNLVAICAHLGGWGEWERASGILHGRKNVYVDTSSSMYAVSPKRVRDIIRSYGVENVLFGTDYPMWTAKEELERLDEVGLTDAEKEAILHTNAERLLHI